MGTKLSEMRDGCFHKAMDDEPMFILLARDPAAPMHVRIWSAARKVEIAEGKRPASDMAQVHQAEWCADQMEHWREANEGRWRKDEPELAYSGFSDQHVSAQEMRQYIDGAQNDYCPHGFPSRRGCGLCPALTGCESP